VRRVPVEVLAGVSFYQAEQAIGVLRDAGIPVEVREVLTGDLPGVWVHVAASDARKARALLAERRFPVPVSLAGRTALDVQPPGELEGDDVWALLARDETPWPSVYSFP
jgi:hypothetical protein